MKNKNSLNPENFSPLYAFEGIGYLFSEHFLRQYSNHDTLVVFDNGFFRSFISKSGMKRTLNDGLKLLSDKNLFDEFMKDFSAYLRRAKAVIHRFEGKKEIGEKDWKKLSGTLEAIWIYHDKTEFIFTDKAFLHSDKNLTIRKNLQRIGRIKFPSSEVLHKLGLDLFYRILERIADAHSVSREDIKFYSKKEVFDLFYGARPQQREIQVRQKEYVLYGARSKVYVFDKKETSKIVRLFRPKKARIKKLRGTTASHGAVIGIARVILADYGNDFRAVEKHLGKMQQGEILVTENTTLQFLPYFKKAAAVITNQGGLNSHAAITSREYRIPCLVAVPNATELIKTGDKLSIVAKPNEGVIKILSRKK